MRLERHPILRTQRAEIERGHDGGERRRGGLMAADLQAVGALAQVIGVVDGPARKPQDLFFELAEGAKLVGARVRLFALGHRSRFNSSSGMTKYLCRAGAKSEPRSSAGLWRQQDATAGIRQIGHARPGPWLRRRGRRLGMQEGLGEPVVEFLA